MRKVLLLRGVNVAGANRLPMPEFRALLGPVDNQRDAMRVAARFQLAA
ncbi:DUF1697 domain-containing protein [Tabrizicola sp.]